ncbi:MAG TPA: hypothetical protein DCG65_07250 [Hyphomonas atlantica]|uniref:Uncharacterized protein n=1 Tax=Hyphomonas atlantica TaxID=1280948 RepID=A0A3B9L094_9PROT|nr:hypothetical protein [Hyphomonas atlantica]
MTEELSKISKISEQAGQMEAEVAKLKDDTFAEHGKVSQMADQSKQLLAATQDQSNQVTTFLESVQKSDADAKTAKASVDTLLSEIKSSEQISKNAVAAINAAEAETKQNREHIEKLKMEVEQQLEKLDVRMDDFRDFISTSETRTSQLAELAESMLAGATNASLSSSFKGEADALEAKSKWAQFWFSLGIVALFASLAPLLLLLFGDEQPAVTIESILARSILVAPSIWFCSFMARRYSALFELRHHYGHKHNMTFSLNAFKKQLTDDNSGITKEVFESISRNPADILRRHGKMSEGPFGSLLGSDNKKDHTGE